MHSKIFKILKSIPKNKPIVVEWLDASTTNHAKIDRFPLPNYYVETRRRTTGTFLCLQKGRFQEQWHLILELDHTEELGSSVRSIPVCLIYNIIGAKDEYDL